MKIRMSRHISALCLSIVVISPALLAAQASRQPAVDLLLLQVLLDRSSFSPGEIDGRDGTNTRRAADAYAKARGVANPSYEAVLQKMTEEHGGLPATVEYTVRPEDVAGPFNPDVPKDLMQQASLPSLAYRSPAEALAERFHASPALLARLNPSAKFAAGDRVVVPNVNADAPAVPPATKDDQKVGTAGVSAPTVVVRVSKGRSALEVVGPDGKVLLFAPVTSGSEKDPLPIGEWKVTGVARNPPFRYNPDLFWDADPTHAKATIKPGPNNPVGVVWIDINKPHYGLHGTPEPARVGKTESHGCVRLTNWDALRLAALVRPGTKVLFTP